MKQRNVALCILFCIITCGIYSIYWMIVLNNEILDASGRRGMEGGLVFLFSLITCGIYGIYWMYQMGVAIESIHEQHNEPRGYAPIVYLLLSLFGLGIIAFALMQDELNRHRPLYV